MSSQVKMKIPQNLLFIFCISLTCVTDAAEVIHVSGYEGSAVRVSCNYSQGYEFYEKYMCKNGCGGSDVIITTSETKKNKYSINDDKKAQTFTVTISDLQYKDAGKYRCGVVEGGSNIGTEVRVDVFPDSCCHSVTKIQSYDGGSVSISCPYESVYQNNLKYICRGNQPSTCLQQAVVISDSKQTTQFTLTDDRKSQFTVTITNLTQKDSGSYLCGVHRNTGLDVFSAVELEVTDVTYQDYILPAALTPLLIITLVLVMVLINKICKLKGVCRGERRTFNHIYANQDVVMRSKQKQKSAC
ncbi:polymeric immunoglobulin receptor-like [Parambassis ranga]|uniref:polymeric immunoglobulin receptor-like n=1 Tax=Parambassis ranga TaxID=210632 RepID=UPI0010424834|nr:polymeric immunoglobulin receptor-like [Parambassis ranga]XP_028259992.1 polymeric immunoglobulin receptor-like [Parambassis ranga]